MEVISGQDLFLKDKGSELHFNKLAWQQTKLGQLEHLRADRLGS